MLRDLSQKLPRTQLKANFYLLNTNSHTYTTLLIWNVGQLRVCCCALILMWPFTRLFDRKRSAYDAQMGEDAKLTVNILIDSIRQAYKHNLAAARPVPFADFQSAFQLKDRYRLAGRAIQVAPKGTFSERQLKTAEGLSSESNWWRTRSITESEMWNVNVILSCDNNTAQSESN